MSQSSAEILRQDGVDDANCASYGRSLSMVRCGCIHCALGAGAQGHANQVSAADNQRHVHVRPPELANCSIEKVLQPAFTAARLALTSAAGITAGKDAPSLWSSSPCAGGAARSDPACILELRRLPRGDPRTALRFTRLAEREGRTRHSRGWRMPLEVGIRHDQERFGPSKNLLAARRHGVVEFIYEVGPATFSVIS